MPQARSFRDSSSDHCPPRSLLGKLTAIAFLVSASEIAGAAPIQWTNPAGGSWYVASNWSSAVVPGTDDDVELPDLGTPYAVDIDQLTSNVIIRSLTIRSGASLDLHGMTHSESITAPTGIFNEGRIINAQGAIYAPIENRPTGVIVVDAGSAWFDLKNPTLLNNGVIENTNGTLRVSTNVTILGSGELRMSEGSVSGNSGTSLRNGPGHVIRGGGSIGVPLANEGTLHADAGVLSFYQVTPNPGINIVSDGGSINFGSFTQSGATVIGDNGTIRGTFVGGDMLVENTLYLDGSVTGTTIHGDGVLSLSGTANGVSIWGNLDAYLGPVTLSNPSIAPEVDVRLLGQTNMNTSLTHDGPIRLQAGANIRFAAGTTLSGTGVFRNDGGLMIGQGGSFTNASGHTIVGHGSCISVVNDGLIEADVPFQTLEFFPTNHGTLRAINGGIVKISNVIFTNTGTITASGGTVRIEDNAVLENTGGQLLAAGGNVLLSRVWGSTLRGGTIGGSDGGSLLTSKDTRLENLTITAGADLRVLAEKTTLSNFVNDGTIRVAGGTVEALGNALVGSGNVTLEGGTVRAYAGALSQTVNHRLRGSGTVASSFSNQGRVQPGASPGTLQFTGDYYQGLSGRLDLEFSGTSAGAFDRIVIGGTAHLEGTISATMIDGYTPASGDAFQVMQASARSGEFTTYEGFDLGGDTQIIPIYANAGEVLVLRVNQGTVGVDPVLLPAELRFRAVGTSGDFALELPEAAGVSLRLFDVSGRIVWTLDRTLDAGRHRLAAGGGIASGVYFAHALIRGARSTERRATRLIVVR